MAVANGAQNLAGFTAPLPLSVTRPQTRSAVTKLKLNTSRLIPVFRPSSKSIQQYNHNNNTLKMAFSSIEGILTPPPVSLPEDLSLVIRSVYQQVFGNAYIMESEQAELKKAESQFRMNFNVREFIRSIVMSDTYKDRFFHSVSQYRFVELAFKHLLGRAPESKSEYALAMSVYNNQGYESFISSFLDSEEYAQLFDTQIVPSGIYKGCYSSNELFNRSVVLRLAPGSSDKGRSAQLQYCVLSGDSPNWLSISKALPAGTEKGSGFVIGSYWQSTVRNENAPIRVGTPVPGGVVFY